MSKLHKYSAGEATSVSLGQVGSILIDQSTTDADCVSLKGAFVAIQFIEDTVFGTLTAEASELYPASNGTSTKIDADAGVAATSVTFPQGMTIFGRWTAINLTSGSCIAYVG